MLNSIWTKVKTPITAFVILALSNVLALGLQFRETSALCSESHRRYDTLVAVIVTSTTPSPIVKERVPADQYKQLVAYYADLRSSLLKSVGDPPQC